MLDKAFKIIEGTAAETLLKDGYQKEKPGPYVASFTNQDLTYIIEYNKGNKQFLLQRKTNETELKTLSVWLFDPIHDTEKEAKTIAADFCDTMAKPKGKIQQKGLTKKDSDQSNSTSLMFFINRLATIFPELKEKIQDEKNNYEEFRGMTFIKESVVPLVLDLLKSGKKNPVFKKFCSNLDNFYANANLDVRSAITIIILNSVEDEKHKKMLYTQVSDDLKKAWKAAQKYKDKPVKPEKVKKRKSLLAKTLEASSKDR